MADMWRVTTTISGSLVVGGGVTDFYFDAAGGTAVQAQTAAKAFWNSSNAFIHSSLTFTTLATIEQVDAANGQVVGASAGTAASVTKTGTGDALPFHTQGLIQWRTGEYSDGREIRGRTFLPGMLESEGVGAAPNMASIGASYATTAAALISDANSTLVIWRRPRKARPQVGVPGDPWYLPAQTERAGSFANAISGSMWTKWAVLRSRRD